MTRRIATEAANPECMAENRHARSAQSAVIASKRPAERRRGAEQVEHVRRHDVRHDAFGFAAVGHECRRLPRDRADGVEAAQPRLEIEVLWCRDGGNRETRLRVVVPDDHRSISESIRQGTKQHRVEDAEDRRVCPDPERHRDDRDKRKQWIPPQHSHCVLGVHLQFLSKLGAIHVGLHVHSNDATFVANEIEIAKALLRRRGGISLAHAGSDVSAPLQLEVRRQFLGDLLVDRDRPDEATQAAGERNAIGDHVGPITFATAAVKCDHCADSARNCARPSGVNE